VFGGCHEGHFVLTADGKNKYRASLGTLILYVLVSNLSWDDGCLQANSGYYRNYITTASFWILSYSLCIYNQSTQCYLVTDVSPTMALQPLWILAAFSVSLSYTQSIGLLGQGIRRPQARYLHTVQHKHRINAHRHACFEWDSKPRSQCLTGRKRWLLILSLINPPTDKTAALRDSQAAYTPVLLLMFDLGEITDWELNSFVVARQRN
jgi:hypothetical protein